MYSELIIKVLIIGVPTYLVAFLTEAMVYTVPMLAITTVIATSIYKKDDIEKRIDSDFKDSKEGFIKNWPTNYNLNGWLISMKKGGKLSAHMHDLGWLSGSIYINVPQKSELDSGNLVVCIDENENKNENKKNKK